MKASSAREGTMTEQQDLDQQLRDPCRGASTTHRRGGIFTPHLLGGSMASIAILAASVLLVAAPVYAAEQQYPAKPVRIIASAVGTTSDLLSRQIGQRLTESWGKTVIVDNRAGA